MMEFIILTLSFTVAILLASGLSLYIMMQPKVMKWYMKFIVKSMKNMDEISEEILLDEQPKDL